MKALFWREIASFFGSLIGYLVMGVFLTLSGLFLFVFDGEFNLLQSGFNDLTPFFTLAPWIFLFLIPAVTMRSISEERRGGTLELLLTHPISVGQLVMGKFWGALFLIVCTLIPTLIYIYWMNTLGLPPGNTDLGSTMGSYIGLLFLAASYTAIGLFTSSLTENQIVAFISAVLVCFFFYFGLDALSNLLPEGLQNASLGMQSHFSSLSRGVIDTRDLLYFTAVSAFFLLATQFKLKTLKA